MNKPPLDIAKQPWVFSPYALISWWDMEQFSAEGLYQIGKHLGEIDRILDIFLVETRENATDALGAPYDLDADQHNDLASHLEVIREYCNDLNLHIAAQCVEEFYETLDSDEFSIKFARVFSKEIGNTVRRELQTVLFFHVPSSRVEFYDQSALFGTEVSAKFPNLQSDIVEAGNCLALGRGTACVFHLMRVMEAAVQELAQKLGVTLIGTTPIRDADWQNILDQINKALKPMNQKALQTIALCEAASHLYHVKIAWRNQVMHPKATYTLEEAEDILRQVRTFMKALAKLP